MPSAQAWMAALQGLGTNLQATGGAPGGANFMRANPGSAWSPGSPNAASLLATLMQMRANQATSLGAPYQPGVKMPTVSLLNG
jgi:hypothetical protein